MYVRWTKRPKNRSGRKHCYCKQRPQKDSDSASTPGSSRKSAQSAMESQGDQLDQIPFVQATPAEEAKHNEEQSNLTMSVLRDLKVAMTTYSKGTDDRLLD